MTNWFLEGAGLTIPDSYWDLGFLGQLAVFQLAQFKCFSSLGIFPKRFTFCTCQKVCCRVYTVRWVTPIHNVAVHQKADKHLCIYNHIPEINHATVMSRITQQSL